MEVLACFRPDPLLLDDPADIDVDPNTRRGAPGIGAALTVGWAMLTGVEPASPLKLMFIAGIVGCAAGLKRLPAGAPTKLPALPPS